MEPRSLSGWWINEKLEPVCEETEPLLAPANVSESGEPSEGLNDSRRLCVGSRCSILRKEGKKKRNKKGQEPMDIYYTMVERLFVLL